MEEDKKTSEYVYEDEHVILTQENELYLKEDWQGDQKKIGEVSKEEVEQKIADLKTSFADLETKVNEVLAEDINAEGLEQLEGEIKNTVAIGDFTKLKKQVQEKKAILEEAEKKNETSEVEDKAQESEVEGSAAPHSSRDSETEEATEAREEESDEDKNLEEEVEAKEETETEVADEADAQETAQEETASEEPDPTSEEDEADQEESFAESKEATAKSDEGETEEEKAEDDPLTYYHDILEKAEDLVKQSDWSYVSMELDNLSHQWSEGPDSDGDEIGKLYQKFNKIVEDFEERKDQHYKDLKKQRQENLETKKKLLEEFEGIISNETWTATRRVNQIKGQWNSTGPLPSDKGDELDQRFEELLDIFNDHKVDRLVQQRQKEEDNLMLKLAVLEKMEKVAKSIDHETTNWKEIDEKFDDLTKQWKKIGRVPKEKSNDVWGRYKSAQDDYYDQKYKYDKNHQSKVDKFYHKKEKICKEAEALLEEDDIASAAREINKLHRRWKKIGNLPQRDEDELWSRFKSATDAFNERKSNNQDKIREQEEKHYQQKLELIEKANEVKNTDDFEKGHSKMQSFMDHWKKIGPVPRNKSNEIWKQFKGAMDEFYDRRRDHFKEVKEERKENLKEKQEILEKLRELGRHEDPIEAVDIAKGLQEKFKNAGYVPIKHKNKMWKQYREACDVIYDRMRAAKSGDKFDQELAKADLDPQDRNKIQKLRKEYNKVKKEAKKLEKEVLQYQEKKTYFKPTDGGNSLLDEVENKIEKVEQKLEKKQQKMDSITEEMDDIREESGN